MKLLGRNILEKFKKKHSNAKSQIDVWANEVLAATWKTPNDIKKEYPSASIIAKRNRIIFNIKGNHYRLSTAVRFCNGIVLVEWIGTHAEYDKLDFTGAKIK